MLRKYLALSLLIHAVLAACGPTSEPRTEPAIVATTAGPVKDVQTSEDSTKANNPVTEDTQIADDSTSLTGSTIELSPKWEVGETRSFEITKTSIDTYHGIKQRKATSRTPLNIAVIAKTEDGYLLRWNLGESENEIIPLGEDPIQDTLMNFDDSMIIEYEVDQRGVPIRIRNWEQIRDLRQQALETSLTALQENGLSQTDLDLIRYILEPMHGTKQQIEDRTLSQVESYHFIYGNGPLDPSSPTIRESFIPNLFRGDPFPAIEQWEISDFAPDDGEITIIKTVSLDPVPARQVLLASMTDMASAEGSLPPTANDLPDQFSIDYVSEAVLDTRSGWIKSLEISMTAIFDAYVNEDMTRFVDITDR